MLLYVGDKIMAFVHFGNLWVILLMGAKMPQGNYIYTNIYTTNRYNY